MDEMDEDFDEGDYFAPDKEEEEDWDSELKLDTGMMAEAQREYADDSDDYQTMQLDILNQRAVCYTASFLVHTHLIICLIYI